MMAENGLPKRTGLGVNMKIRSEYTILTSCIEAGIDEGYRDVLSNVLNPSPSQIKQAIYTAITSNITANFIFDKEEV